MSRLYLGDLAALEAALAQEVRTAKERDALAPVFVVVGSAAVASHLPHVLTVRLGGHANVRIFTVHRLASQLAAAGGLPADRLLTPEARARLVERIVGQIASRAGSYFGPVAGMPGLARAFGRSIEDLRQAGIPAEAEWGPLHGGLADAQAALSAYESALRSAKCTDRAGAYWAALDAIKAGARAGEDLLPPGTPVMIYGLYDLPQSQRVVLGALAERCVLSAFLPYPSAGREYAEPGRQFFAGLGLSTVELPPTQPACLQLLSVGDDEDEVLEVARRVRALQANGVRYHQVAVVAPAADRAQHIARELEAFGVPVARRLVPSGGAVARVLALLDGVSPAAGRSWSRAAVIDFATAVAATGTGPAAADVSRWAEESRQAGVVAGEEWRRLEDRRRHLAARVADLEAGEADAEAPVPAGAAQAGRRRVAAVEALSHFVRSLRTSADSLPAQAPWPEMAAALTSLAAGPCSVAPDDPVLDALAELADCALVEEQVTLTDAVRTARDRLGRFSQPHGAVGRRGVAVLTPHEIRGLRFTAVLFAGLCSGGFPPAVAHDPILPDADRRELARRFGLPLAEAGAHEREADMLFSLTKDAAVASFVGLVPRRDASGAQRQPSRLAVESAEKFTGRVATAEDFLRAPLAGSPLRRAPSGALPSRLADGAASFPADRRPADLRDLDLALLSALRQDGAGGRAAGAPRGYLGQICGLRSARRLLGRRLAGASPAVLAWDGVFRSPAARRAISTAGLFDKPQAPTALQEYPRCPFSYYLLSVLGIEPVEEPEALVEADRREVGKVVHRVLQRVFAAVVEGAGREQAVAMVAAIAEQESREAERRGGVGLPLMWQAQRAQLVEDLTLAVASDPCWSAPDGPQPWRFELTFGGAEAPVAIALEHGRQMLFHGRIDRVDRSADGRRLRVLDYKSGKGAAEKDQVEAGRNVQLPVYLLACRALVDDPGAQVECAFRMVTRQRDHAEVALSADETRVTGDLADTVSAIRHLVEAGVFPRVPASDRMCQWCRAAYACDELKVTRQTKQRHRSLAELARLRRPVDASAALAPEDDDDA